MQYKVVIDNEVKHVRIYDGIAPFVDGVMINYLISSLNLNPCDYEAEVINEDLKGWLIEVRLTSKHKPLNSVVEWDDQDHTVF